MKTVKVAAAVICGTGEHAGKVFAAARGYGEFKGRWEFPGGKAEPGETPPQAAAREIREELGIEITVGDRIGTIEYDYPSFHLSMDCFRCFIRSGTIELREAEAARWLGPEELASVDWLPADRILVEMLTGG